MPETDVADHYPDAPGERDPGHPQWHAQVKTIRAELRENHGLRTGDGKTDAFAIRELRRLRTENERWRAASNSSPPRTAEPMPDEPPNLWADDPDTAAALETSRRQALDTKWAEERRAKPPNCRAANCRARIDWALTPDGKWIPLDFVPTQAGNVEIETQRIARVARVVSAVETGVLAATGRTPPVRYMPHHATCPAADRYRKTHRG